MDTNIVVVSSEDVDDISVEKVPNQPEAVSGSVYQRRIDRNSICIIVNVPAFKNIRIVQVPVSIITLENLNY